MERPLRFTSAREVKIVDARRAHKRKTFFARDELALDKIYRKRKIL
jgi:hypothetical protein